RRRRRLRARACSRPPSRASCATSASPASSATRPTAHASTRTWRCSRCPSGPSSRRTSRARPRRGPRLRATAPPWRAPSAASGSYLGPGRKPEYAKYRCRRAAPVHKAGAPSVSVMRRTADAFLEREFLGRFGRLPVVEVVTTDSDAARTEAIAVARVRLSMARRAQHEARRPEEEDAADAMYAAARRALRDAEALPSDVVTEERATGETFADAWAGADDAQRTALLLKVGPWYVAPGRGLPAEEKIYLGSEPDYLAGQLDD